MAVLELTPLLMSELSAQPMLDRNWLCGGFPDGGIQRLRAFPEWGSNYVRLLAERDLPNLGLSCTPQTTIRLIRMLALTNGQQWNASEIGRSMGLSYQTINSYTDYLEGIFLLRRLPVFHGNMRKRLVKAPKLLWRDSGILHSLLGIENGDSLLTHPALGVRHGASYLRTSDGYEADLVLDCAGERWVIEIKLTSNPGARAFDRLDVCGKLAKATRQVLVSRVPTDSASTTRLSCGLDRFLREIKALAKRANG
jgi:predicted AAA+ superfamily ATPase